VHDSRQPGVPAQRRGALPAPPHSSDADAFLTRLAPAIDKYCETYAPLADAAWSKKTDEAT